MVRIDDERRLARYRKDPRQEERLGELNALLAPLETELTRELAAPRRAVVFIVGVPRSGTTLMAQALAGTRAFAYPSNFVARFWRAPLVGAKIERALGILDTAVRDTASAGSFRSTFGVTRGWHEPHEFGYFWERWFVFRESHHVSGPDLAAIDRDGLRSEVAALEGVYEQPLFFKNLVCGLQIPFLAEVFPTAVFIHCRRDPLYLAQSLLLGRRERHGSSEHWFSLRPKEYTELARLPVPEQIAGQIRCSLEAIRGGLDALGPERSLEVGYEAFCEDPRRQLERVFELLARRGESLTWDRDTVPESFEAANRRRLPDHELAELERAMMAGDGAGP